MKKIFEIRKLLKTLAESKQGFVYIDGYKVRNCERYRFFLKSGFKCHCCQSKANHAVVSKDVLCKSDLYHLSFYIEGGSRDLLLTTDHIIPKALGGKNCVENYQVLCEKCNRIKGDTTINFDKD